ncbi:MAG: outer membrane protein transport protein [Labilithrix sp.]|nr:outer membrane protein transport protein [Labilithrix sp.]
MARRRPRDARAAATRAWRPAGAALAAILGAASPARANPPDTFGFGSRETAMGGAVAAETRGFAASYYNPAALARSRGLEIGVGYFRAEHSLEMNGRDNGVDPVKGMNAGLVAPGKILGLPFAFGVAVHLPDDRVSRVRALRQEQPRWELYDNRNQRLFLAANLAIEPTPWLWIGGGLSFMSSTRGRLDISGGANVFRPDDSRLRHEVDADLTAVRYPQAGVRVALGERVALAAVYRGEFQLALDLTAHLFGDVSGLTTALYELHTRSVNNFLPQQAVLGGSWAVTDRLKTTFDATWIQWSAYVAPVAKLDAVLEIPPPPSGWPSTVTPPTTPAPTRIEPLKMYDRVVPRLGLEWHALGDRAARGYLRGGYELAKSPIAAQSGLTNYVDRDRHTFSLGVGGAFDDVLPELPGTLTIDAHLQLSRLSTGTTLKASAADYVGDYTAGGSIVNVGLTAGFAFGEERGQGAKAAAR